MSKLFSAPKSLVGVSDFASKRHFEEQGYTFTTLTPDQLVRLVMQHWDERTPGAGETDCSRKALVPVPSIVDGKQVFFSPYGLLAEGMEFRGFSARRQKGEDLHIETEVIDGCHYETEPVKFVNIVVYSKDALLENNGHRTTDRDFEIVCVLASAIQTEPMQPISMARNFLDKPGGTKSNYTAEEFAKSIYYWSQRARVRG